MKKFIGVAIIILFLIPLLSHSVKFFKERVSQGKIVYDKNQPGGDVSKVPVSPAFFKNSRKTSIPKEIMKATIESSDSRPTDMLKGNTEEIKPKQQKVESNIHDDILGYRLNSKNHIKQIQTALMKGGFYKGEIDGKAGMRTRRAIKKFQKVKKLNPDGIVGPKTWEALEKYLKN